MTFARLSCMRLISKVRKRHDNRERFAAFAEIHGVLFIVAAVRWRCS